MFLSLFNSFASALHPPDVVCLQDSPFGALAFLSLVVLNPFTPLTPPALSLGLLFMVLVVFCPMLRFFLCFLRDRMLLLWICSGLISLVVPLPSFVF